jgi:two-component system, NtrC family, sensor kinase
MDNIRPIASTAKQIDIPQFIEPLSSPLIGVYNHSHLGKTNISKLLDLSLEMLGVIGLDGYFEQLTPVWEECLGFSRDELQAKPWMSWIDDEDTAATRKQIKRLLDGEQTTVTFKNRVRCKNGDRKWLHWQVVFCPDSKLLYAKIQNSGIKATQRIPHLKSDRSLPEPDDRFRHLVEGIKDFGIYMLDESGRFISWNPGAEKISAWKEKDTIGKSFSLLFPLDQIEQDKPQELLKSAVKTGRAEYENWHIRRDETRFWGHIIMTVLKDEAGKILGFATVMQDKTVQHKIEEALHDSYEEMEQKIEERTAVLRKSNEKLLEEIRVRKRTELYLKQSKASLKHQAHQLEQTLHTLQQTQAQLVHNEKMLSLGQLVAGLAHEINNPVNFIHGNLSYIKSYIEDLIELIQAYQKHYSNPAPELQERLEEIDLEFIQSDIPNILSSMNIGTQRIIKIVESLRNFSRHDEAQIKKVDIHEGIESTLVILSHQLSLDRFKEIKIVKEYKDLPKIECYASHVNQALMHIFQNSIDALAEKFQTIQEYSYPTIWIQTEAKESSILIKIKDNGAGMSADVCQRAFDPFFTTKPIGQGTGLGLSTSYKIVVEQHRGQLTCVSTPGEGTKLTIEIPTKQQ